MSNKTSALRTALTGVFRLNLGILLCLFSLAAQAVQPRTIQFDLFSVQFTHTDIKQFSEYQLSTSVANTTANSFVFSKAFRLPTLSELKKGTFWTTSIRWHYADNGIESSLSPRLRFESKESQIEMNPLKRSVSMTWHRELP